MQDRIDFADRREMEPNSPIGSPTALRAFAWLAPVLRVPLAGKIAGANALIAGAALAVSAAGGDHITRLQLEGRMLVALGVACAVNTGLVLIALRPLTTLQMVAGRASGGEPGSRVPPSRVADRRLTLLGETWNSLLDSLAAERARLRRLASHTIATADRDRARVGRELHDGTAQYAAALFFQLVALERDATAHATSPAVNGEQHRAEARHLAERALAIKDAAAQLLEQVRSLAQSLHPRVLEDLGLAAALRHLARQVAERAGIPVEVDAEGVSEVPSARAATLYWVAEEALANAARHASPSRIRLRLRTGEGSAWIEVADDGSGFAPSVVDGTGTGIFMMRERLAVLDGGMELYSAPGAGTHLVARLPVSQPDPQ